MNKASEEDLRVARGVVREVDRHFDASERLRLGKWIDPDERERTIAQYIATALTAARAETWDEAIAIVKNPRLKSGAWTKREDEVAEVIQQRMAFALECASRGEDYRNSLEAAAGSKTKVEDEQKNLGR